MHAVHLEFSGLDNQRPCPRVLLNNPTPSRPFGVQCTTSLPTTYFLPVDEPINIGSGVKGPLALFSPPLIRLILWILYLYFGPQYGLSLIPIRVLS